MTPDAWLDKLYALERQGIKLGLEPTQRLLESCGNPHKSYRTIQIAGTNGKGSTAAMLAAILGRHGNRTGLYTSPHLVRFNERIRIDGVCIPDNYIRTWMEKHAGDIEDLSTTFFEATTVMALCYFRDRGIDWAVLETGLGGRLDATTAAESGLTAICPIAMDHTDILGATLSAIAGEKAGILRRGITCISAQQPVEAEAVLRSASEKVGAPLHFVSGQNPAPAPERLKGRHQQQNAALAWTIAETALGSTFLPEEARKAIISANWPGRFQLLGEKPLVVYDVAHNPHGIDAILATLADEKVAGRRWAVLALQQDKEADEVVEKIARAFDHLIITETRTRKYLSAAGLAATADRWPAAISVEPDASAAILLALERAAQDDLVAILGSHYLGPAVAAVFKISFDNLS